MEFPELGKQCNTEDCKALDFLPIECSHCQKLYCKDHAGTSEHNCSQFVDNFVTEKKFIEVYKCNISECQNSDAVEMKCIKCMKHFCLSHRHHGCLDAPPTQSKKDKYRLPKEQFKKAKAETDLQVQERLKKAKNRALANKIKLMKVKGSAVGAKTIPTLNRMYFLVAPPLGDKEKSTARAVFVDKTWNCGQVIDCFAKRLKVENSNNNPAVPQLRLFTSEGYLLGEKFSTGMQELLDDGSLVDGDSVILEYITNDQMTNNESIFNVQSLSKYSFI